MSKPGRIAVACLGLLGAPAAAQQFLEPVVPTPNPARAIAVIDLDGDSHPDLATANYVAHTISLLRAKPAGGYEPALNWQAGNGPVALAVADMDLDGDDDLVVLSQNDGQLAILRLADNGETVTAWNYPFSGQPLALAVGDLDGDGDTDVVVAETQLDRISVRLGLGPIGMGPATTYPVGTSPNDVALVDLDGDGVLDAVTANWDSSDVSVCLGDGAGGFLAPSAVATGGSSRTLAVADFDGDSDADVAVGVFQPNTVRLLLGDGNGGLVAGATLPLNGFPFDLLAGALDGDGPPDLVVTSSVSSGFGVLTNTGGGAFAPVVDHMLSTSHDCGALADLDQDGRLDLALDAPAGVILVAGDGSGGFLKPAKVPLSPALAFVTAADVDGDGIDDLVGAKPLATGVEVRLGDGVGGLGAPVSSPVLADSTMLLADLDGDGALDLIGSSFSSLNVNLGDGAGGFAPAGSVALGEYLADSAAADMDGDGDTDVVVITSLAFFNQEWHSVGVLLGDGAGGLSWGQNLQAYGTYATYPTQATRDNVVVGDIDGDRHADVVIRDSTDSKLRLFLGTGTGTLSAAGTIDFFFLGGSKSDPLLLADLDEDSALDIVLRTSSAVTALFGNGNGSFGPETTVAALGFGRVVRSGDVDGDGHLDLVTDGSSTHFVVLTGDGAGVFEPSLFGTGGATDSPLLAQLDGGGLPDVLSSLSAGSSINAVFISLNRTLSAQWADIGHGLAGSNGVPKLVGTGTLQAGSPGTLKLSNANPSKLAVLFISKQSTPAPFKGGVLATVPPLISFMLVTSPSGTINLSWNNWPGGFPGSTWYFQYGVVDSGGPAGAALSNALRATQP